MVETAEELCVCSPAAMWVNEDEGGGWCRGAAGSSGWRCSIGGNNTNNRDEGRNQRPEWQQGVQLVVVTEGVQLEVVWLVVPVEAVSNAQTVGGMVAAATSAAVGASTVLNYWTGLEDSTVGDLEVLSKGKGVIRIVSTNLRRAKRDESVQDMSKVVWEQTVRAMEDVAVDIWAAQDTRVEDGGAPGQAVLWSAGRLKDEVGLTWAGMKMG